jgi:hypothetical protein
MMDYCQAHAEIGRYIGPFLEVCGEYDVNGEFGLTLVV